MRAVLAAFRWEKQKGGNDESLPNEDIAGHRRLRGRGPGDHGGGRYRREERLRASLDPCLARRAHTPRTRLREEGAPAAGPRDPRPGGTTARRDGRNRDPRPPPGTWHLCGAADDGRAD